MTTKALMVGTLAGVMAFGAGQAQAGAKAFSSLQIIDAIVTDTSGIQLAPTDFSFTDTANTGSIAGSVTGGVPFLFLPGLNVSGCSGAGCPPAVTGPGMNDINTSGQFSRAFNTLTGSVLSPSTGVDSDTVAETILTDTGVGGANAFTGSSIDFSFSLIQAQAIRIQFDAILMLYVELHQEEVSSIANAAWSITIEAADGTEVLGWAPDGTNSCTGAGCSILDEDFSLNEEVSQLSTGFSEVDPGFTGFFRAETAVLSANVLYTVTISQDVNVAAEAIKVRVPEPATLLLFGTGLLGMGLMGWRRRRQTAA